MDIRRVALIYDDRDRPETTGVYCRRALGAMVAVEHFRPGEIERIASGGFDLYLNVDDGLDYTLPEGLHPSAWWAIDTHLSFDRCLEKARTADLVFAAQRDGANALQAAGIASARWLPLACDPEVHCKHAVDKVHDIAFVGNVFPGPRADLLACLRRRFPKTLIGRAYFEEMAKAYSAVRIVFNRSIQDDVNMRVFEALGCGSLLLTNDLAKNGQAELFRNDVHLATYSDEDELLDKAAFYLRHEALRERIAAAGRAEVLARHTYRDRMETVLQQAGRTATTTGVPFASGLDDPHPNDGYYENVRPELLALVPMSARRVLDVGCGAGRLGEALKGRQQAEVVGIEVCAEAARRAVRRLDRVITGDVERLDPTLGLDTFDCIVCGDVIEHLREPRRFLERARQWLKPGGVLVASLPNVRHVSVVASLLMGDWTYEPAGLLDETHLNFFTRSDLLELFERSGYKVTRLGIVPGPGYEAWRTAGSPGEVQMEGLHIAGLTAEDAEEFYAYQYLLVAEPSTENRGHGTEESALGGRGRMRFTQDFVRDFEQFDLRGRPFAFVRFGDGERSICRGEPVVSGDGWEFDGRGTRFSAELDAALTYAAPDYYIGISDGCCDHEARDWFLERVKVPLEQVTFANIFVNGNYQRFRALDLSGTALVASCGGDFTIPEDLVNGEFDIDGLVDRLLDVDVPILVAAGPASCVLIHKYWLRPGPKQTIVDVGSAIDERIKGRKTRRYHFPGSPTADRICQW